MCPLSSFYVEWMALGSGEQGIGHTHSHARTRTLEIKDWTQNNLGKKMGKSKIKRFFSFMNFMRRKFSVFQVLYNSQKSVLRDQLPNSFQTCSQPVENTEKEVLLMLPSEFAVHILSCPATCRSSMVGSLPVLRVASSMVTLLISFNIDSGMVQHLEETSQEQGKHPAGFKSTLKLSPVLMHLLRISSGTNPALRAVLQPTTPTLLVCTV